MIIVNFFTTLRIYLNSKQLRIQADEMSVQELLRYCETKLSRPFFYKLVDNDGSIRPGAMILVNGQNILHLHELQTIVRNGASVALFPPGGGG
ncbi:molybdopterin synthase sulfur carrier subunit [candidate division KSB3 bacterium]|uniref:Molybdopterin synthase sulfur carrier subunit n=1 Tax=candidate division KSB3 bacterium TaxID=2044937 RepID=A0A2G6K8T1_9BACT|nr:MAG: molybdopterin synthase sulfur carrier subunit [candidate division KSB3 bacterium]